MIFVNYPLETFTPTSSGAIATYIWELCRAARAQGVEPLVITRASPAAMFAWPRTVAVAVPEPSRSGLPGIWHRGRRRLGGWRHLGEAAYAARVADALARGGMEAETVLLQNSPELAIFLRRRLPRLRILHLFQNQLEAADPVRAEFGGAVDVVAAVSRFTAAWVCRHYSLPAAQVRVVLSGVDPDAFHPPQTPAPGPPVIGFVGRTGIEKAPDLLLRAAARVAEQTTGFALQLVGSNHWDRFEVDAYQERLAALAAGLERQGVRVRRPGHVGREALPAEFRRAHVHVVPSRWDEPFGLSTLEGMATGLATVASRTGGTPEVLDGAGLLFERDSVDELAAHLLRLVRDPELRADHGRRARRRAEELTWTRTWNEWQAALPA